MPGSLLIIPKYCLQNTKQLRLCACVVMENESSSGTVLYCEVFYLFDSSFEASVLSVTSLLSSLRRFSSSLTLHYFTVHHHPSLSSPEAVSDNPGPINHHISIFPMATDNKYVWAVDSTESTQGLPDFYTL